MVGCLEYQLVQKTWIKSSLLQILTALLTLLKRLLAFLNCAPSFKLSCRMSFPPSLRSLSITATRPVLSLTRTHWLLLNIPPLISSPSSLHALYEKVMSAESFECLAGSSATEFWQKEPSQHGCLPALSFSRPAPHLSSSSSTSLNGQAVGGFVFRQADRHARWKTLDKNTGRNILDGNGKPENLAPPDHEPANKRTQSKGSSIPARTPTTRFSSGLWKEALNDSVRLFARPRRPGVRPSPAVLFLRFSGRSTCCTLVSIFYLQVVRYTKEVTCISVRVSGQEAVKTCKSL